MDVTTAATGILDALDMGVVLLDNGWRVRQWNAWMARAAGVPVHAAVGQAIGAVFPSITGSALGGAIGEALGSGASSMLSDTLHGQVLPLHCADGRALLHNVLVSRVGGEGAPCCLIQVQDVTARRDAEAALRRSEERARARLAEVEALYDAAPIGLGLFDQDLRFLRVNEMLADINGAPREEHVGRCAWEIVPDLRELAEPLFRRVFETGEPILGIELSGTTRKLPGVVRTWVEDYYPLRGAHGEVIAVGAIVREITEQKRLEARERLLTHELQHRLKNTFAMIKALASQTARGATSLPDYLDRFGERIRALAVAQDLLVRCPAGDAVSLPELAHVALAPFVGSDGARLSIQLGVETVSADAASDLALALHELATNATKYGALSEHGGRVRLTACVEEWTGRPEMCLEWREEDGPSVQQPDRQGFGSRLLRMIAERHGGRVDLEWQETGLVCRICLPTSAASAVSGS
jgi:PAS domain S-box-containing protein